MDNYIHPKYRADIDGLRAIAVLSVVAFHAFPNWVGGGFVGVDIFFVISGFLIASIIFGSLDKGSFSFVEFYVRRIKRIFPALILVLVACYFFGAVVLLPEEFKQLGKHIAGGAGFISNFVLWRESGYFDNAAVTKPLLHLWSLGIEEQFYIVWPLLLYLSWKRKLDFFWVTLLVLVGSFALNVVFVRAHVVAAFYTPFTRFWELLIGSLLAYATLRKQSLFLLIKQPIDLLPESKLRNAKSIAGLVFIVVALVALNKYKAFPGWWALLPTLGTYLLISAGPEAWLNRRVLSHRMLVWFGLISFPLYLWHWPLLSFARILESATPSIEIRIAAIIVSILLAWLTYRLIEQPIRFGKFGNVKVVVLCLLMLIIGYAGHLQGKTIYFQNLQFIDECKINNLNLYVPKFIDNRDFCFHKPAIKETDVNIIVFGDSHANRLYLGLSEADSKNRYLNLGRGTCLPFLGVDGKAQDIELQCQPTMSNLLDKITKSNATIIIVTAFYARYFDGRIESSLPIKDIQKSIDSTLAKLDASGKRIIISLDVPILPFNPEKCLARPIRLSSQSECKFPRKTHEKDSALYKSSLLSSISKYRNISVFDPADVLCDIDFCYGAKQDSVLYKDDHHLNLIGSELVAKKLIKLFPAQ